MDGGDVAAECPWSETLEIDNATKDPPSAYSRLVQPPEKPEHLMQRGFRILFPGELSNKRGSSRCWIVKNISI